MPGRKFVIANSLPYGIHDSDFWVDMIECSLASVRSYSTQIIASIEELHSFRLHDSYLWLSMTKLIHSNP